MKRTKAELIKELNTLETKLKISKDNEVVLKAKIDDLKDKGEKDVIKVKKDMQNNYNDIITNLTNEKEMMQKFVEQQKEEVKHLSQGLLELNELIEGLTASNNVQFNINSRNVQMVKSRYFNIEEPQNKKGE